MSTKSPLGVAFPLVQAATNSAARTTIWRRITN
jgi:hypothetical protein